MESNQRFYWRRAAEELYAAERAVTPAAQSRRRQLAEYYIGRLRESGVTFDVPRPRAPSLSLAAERRSCGAMFEWPLRERGLQAGAAAARAEWPLRSA
jgi:hypothetical protein